MQPRDPLAAGERLGMRHEQAAVALPLAAWQHDERAQQPVGTVALQPDEADNPFVVGQLEEDAARLV
jgi:hypothetical protein